MVQENGGVPPIEILTERLVYENAYGTLWDDEVRFHPSEAEGSYVRWTWTAPHSVAILPELGTDFCLIKSYRHSLRGYSVEVPKGFGDHDLTPEQSASKELLEETGLIATRMEYLGTFHTDAAFCATPMHCFVARSCTLGTPNHEATETIATTVLISQASTRNDVFSAGVTDTTSLLLLEMYRRDSLR
ncbi:MAG: NUDIX hydrolase [Nocardioides sp.]